MGSGRRNGSQSAVSSGLGESGVLPGIEMPGYSQLSLRDKIPKWNQTTEAWSVNWASVGRELMDEGARGGGFDPTLSELVV